jgi:hypothetical protein
MVIEVGIKGLASAEQEFHDWIMRCSSKRIAVRTGENGKWFNINMLLAFS